MKPLESLKHIAISIVEHFSTKEEPMRTNKINEILYCDDFKNIGKALQEYEMCEKILKDYGLTLANFREACLLLAMLKGEGRNIHNIDKQLKALEIIKEKKVNVSLLINTKNYYNYNDHVIRAQVYLQSNAKCLTQEEFDLLKEILL